MEAVKWMKVSAFVVATMAFSAQSAFAAYVSGDESTIGGAACQAQTGAEQSRLQTLTTGVKNTSATAAIPANASNLRPLANALQKRKTVRLAASGKILYDDVVSPQTNLPKLPP